MSNYKQLGKNTILVFVGNIGSKMITFVMLPFYTKWLSVEDYGVSDNALVYASLLLGIVSLSISESIFIFPKDQETSKQKQFFTAGLFYSSILLCGAGFILFGVKEFFSQIGILKSITDNYIFIYSLVVALFFQTFLQQFSRSINNIKVYSISGVVLTLLTAVFSIAFIPNYGLVGFFIAQILSYIVSGVYTFIHSKAYNYISFKTLSLERYKEMLKYSIPLIPNAVMWWLVGSLNRPVMEEYLGMHAVGLFAVSNKFPSLVNVLFSVFMVSWQISVIEEFKKENYEKFYNNILKIVFLFLIICVMTISILGKALTGFVADAKFIDSWKYIPILSLSALFSSISGFVGCNFSATRESKYYFYSSIWGALIAIVFNFLLIPIWGLYGAVVAIVLSHLTMMLSRVKYSWKTVKIKEIYLYVFMLMICFTDVMVSSFISNNYIIIITFLISIAILAILMRKDIMNGIQFFKFKFFNK
ncbi:lipopolysaccharide biosynthesis protein [Flavobacterium sp. 3-210]